MTSVTGTDSETLHEVGDVDSVQRERSCGVQEIVTIGLESSCSSHAYVLVAIPTCFKDCLRQEQRYFAMF